MLEHYSEAESLYERAIRLLEGAVEPTHPNLIACLENYSTLLYETGRSGDARQLERRAAAARKRPD
jgi:hypothetical protein